MACVGGLGAKTLDRGLNRAVDMERQVGSTMKGVAAYPLAIDYGVAYYSKLVEDSPVQEHHGERRGKTVAPELWQRGRQRRYDDGV